MANSGGGWAMDGPWFAHRGQAIVSLDRPFDTVWYSPDGFTYTLIEDTGTVDGLLTELGWRIRCWNSPNGEVSDNGSDTQASLRAVLGR